MGIHPALHAILLIAQLFAAFLALTSYGAMWRGAENHGRKGWFVAAIWAVGLVVGLSLMHSLDYHLETAGRALC